MATDNPLQPIRPIAGRGPTAGQTRDPRRRPPGHYRRRSRRKRRPAFQIPTARQLKSRALLTRLLVVVGAFACGPLVFWNAQGQRALPALGILAVLLMLFAKSPGLAVSSLLLYLGFLGGMRRWLTPALGWSGSDPFILVGPGIALLISLNLLFSRTLPRDTRVSRLLPWLLGIMFLQIFNPLQGGLGVGLAGALFALIPVLWYYVGRETGSERVVSRLLGAVMFLSIAGACYGLYQTLVGFPAVEKDWIKLNSETYNALYVTATLIRAFSFFTSAQEYGQFLTFGIVIAWAAFLRGWRLALLPIPLLAYAIFLESSRGAVVVTLATCAVLWGVQGRSLTAWLPRMALAVVLAAGGLFWSLTQVQDRKLDANTQALVQHQVNGLLNPTEAKSSTAVAHVGAIGDGILQGFKVPVGRGLGSTTIATKYSDDEDNKGGSTEVDLSDAFASLGFAGGFVYLAVVIAVLAAAARHWRTERSFPSLALLGVIIAHLGHWLHGGSYAATTVVWLCIGAVEQAQAARAEEAQTLEQAAIAEAA